MLAIDDVDLKFAVTIAQSEVAPFEKAGKDAVDQMNSESRSRFYVSFARRQRSQTDGTAENGESARAVPPDDADTVQVSIKFKALGLTEGAARLQDMLNLEIDSRSLDEDELQEIRRRAAEQAAAARAKQAAAPKSEFEQYGEFN
jgi:hypothetical protein